MDKQVLQLGTSKTKQLNKQLTLWLLHFLLFISNSGNTDQPQMETRTFEAISALPHCCERVAKADKHQAPGAANHEFSSIGSAIWTVG